jgi:hypothetical protein
MRVCRWALVLAVVPAGIYLAREERAYPYPVAYRFGFDYREASLKECNWQKQFFARHEMGQDTGGGIKLTQFWPRFPDTQEGAALCWQERRKVTPLPYFEPGSMTPREPTSEEVRLERQGWIAGYMDSVYQHPLKD